MKTALVWFRRDLRLENNPAFITACNHYDTVIPIYIDTPELLLGQAQRWWLHHSLLSLEASLKKIGLNLILKKGNAFDILLSLIEDENIEGIFWNRLYEPKALEKDKTIKAALKKTGKTVESFNSHLLNEPWTIQNNNGEYFKVFTPYWKHCLKRINRPEKLTLKHPPKSKRLSSDKLEEWGLLPKRPNWAAGFSDYWEPGEGGAKAALSSFLEDQLNYYKMGRNFPGKRVTSHLSPHLHFGEISPWDIWEVVNTLQFDKHYHLSAIEVFLSELGWREFSYHLLYHFPALEKDNFKPAFNDFSWEHNRKNLLKWQRGQTGFPLVDAGMRELWATGYMHNRVRMIVASFLTKDLLIDWREGAAWFLDTLLDADLAANSMNWQWVAGCGVDAAPYFRIFNPILQSEKFDPEGVYIKRWVPELAHLKGKALHQPWEGKKNAMRPLIKDYPLPLVDHAVAREEALERYKRIK